LVVIERLPAILSWMHARRPLEAFTNRKRIYQRVQRSCHCGTNLNERQLYAVQI
jgi:hypothetical protein